MKSVIHVLGPSLGGIRRHVRYLAAHPPAGWKTAGIVGPSSLSGYFAGSPFISAGRFARVMVGGSDLIHAHGLTASLSAMRPRFHRPPLVLTLHMDVPLQGRTAANPILLRLAPFVASRAEATIGVSPRIAELFPGARYIPPAVDPLPPPGRDRVSVRADLGAEPDDVVVLALARLHPDKRLDILIDSIRSTRAVCWIAGEGPDRARLERLAQGARIRLLGYRGDVPDLLAAADVTALTSAGEGYPIAVVESIMAGTPVVATRAGAIADIVGDAGVTADPGDVKAFATALARVVEDGAELERLRRNAASRRLPSPEQLVAQVGAVYDEVVPR